MPKRIIEIPGTYIHIRSNLFPKMEGEESELVNPNTYGKAFALFLQKKLVEAGYKVPYACGEDWGWWVKIAGLGYTLGLCCYAPEDENGNLNDFVCCSSVERKRTWSWRRFRKVDCESTVVQLMDTIEGILKNERGIEMVARVSAYPL